MNYIVQNKGLKVEIKNREEISADLNVNQVTNQSYLVIHQIEGLNIFIKKYPFKIFIEQKLSYLDKIWWKITQIH